MSFIPIPDNKPESINKAFDEFHKNINKILNSYGNENLKKEWSESDNSQKLEILGRVFDLG